MGDSENPTLRSTGSSNSSVAALAILDRRTDSNIGHYFPLFSSFQSSRSAAVCNNARAIDRSSVMYLENIKRGGYSMYSERKDAEIGRMPMTCIED